MMEKPVLIKVNSRIRHTKGEEETLSSSYTGTLYQKGEEFTLKYQENAEEMGKTSTYIKWVAGNQPIKLTIIRYGETKMNQVFRSGSTERSQYQIPNGVMELETFTEQVAIQNTAGLGKITLIYQLKLNKQPIGFYSLVISFTETE